MILLPCKICGGKVDWCACSDEGCHMIVCKKCKATFDLSESVPNDADTLEQLRQQIAEHWNTPAPAIVHTPLTELQVKELLPDFQNGWSVIDYGMWVARAVERAHGIGGGA